MKALKTAGILLLFILAPFASQAWDSYKVTVLPLTNGASTWYDLNDAGQVAGYHIDNVTWVTNQAVMWNLSAPTNPLVRFPFLVSTRPTSKGYTISQSGVVFGSSKHSTENRQKSVRLRESGAPDLLYNEGNMNCEAVDNGLNGRRVLIAGGSTGGAFIYNADNSNTYPICTTLANSWWDSTAMNESGQVAYAEVNGVNQFYFCELKGTTLVKSNLTALTGSTAVYIRGMNSSKVIVGERSTGGVYKGYVYNYPSNILTEWSAGGVYFRDINNSGLIAGLLNTASAGCIASVQPGGTLAITNLNGCLDPSASGWFIEDAVAINNHNVILAQARKSGSYTSPTYVLLTPSTYIPEPGAQIMVIQTGTVSGVNVSFTNVLSPGVFNRTFDASRDAAYWNSQYAGLLAALDPSIPTNTNLQMWDLTFSGTFGGAAQVTLYYNNSALPGPEANLTILHYNNNTLAWEPIAGAVVDSVNHTITFATTSFSPFILSVAAPSGHTITASAGPNGSISPTGAVSVANGANQTFIIQANPLCRINDILTNSTSIAYPFDNSHTNFNFCWSNVQSSGTIEATFTPRLSASGTPHTWLYDFYPTSNDLSQVATLDTDNDKLTADQEYIAGTDPTNGNSRFFINTVTFSNNTVMLTAIPAVSNRNYQLLSASNMDTNFVPVTNNITTESGTVKVIATNESAAAFFQLEVSLP